MITIIYIGQPKAYDTFLAQTGKTKAEVTRCSEDRQLHGLRDVIIIRGFGWFEIASIGTMRMLADDNIVLTDHHTGVDYLLARKVL